jgi:hypothetical protein
MIRYLKGLSHEMDLAFEFFSCSNYFLAPSVFLAVNASCLP